jgi:hypothetical protein
MNVKRLDGRQLNYWVARSAGLKLSAEQACIPHDPDSGHWHPHSYNPANDWAQAGAILSAEWFGIEDTLVDWFGTQWPHLPALCDGPLKWFMRAYVATQFGNEVEDYTPFEDSDAANSGPASGNPAAVHSPVKTRSSAWFRPINW